MRNGLIAAAREVMVPESLLVDHAKVFPAFWRHVDVSGARQGGSRHPEYSLLFNPCDKGVRYCFVKDTHIGGEGLLTCQVVGGRLNKCSRTEEALKEGRPRPESCNRCLTSQMASLAVLNTDTLRMARLYCEAAIWTDAQSFEEWHEITYHK